MVSHVSPAQARRLLGELVRRDPSPFPWDEAALYLAVDAYPHLDAADCLRQIDSLAERVRERHDAGASRVAALQCALGQDAGFQGDRDSYYDPQNSYLNRVLERRRGLPITLAILTIAIGNRLGWQLAPVNFPYHFLVTLSGDGEPIPMDPFNGWQVMIREELEAAWRQAELEPRPFGEMLTPAPPLRVLLRVLNNLKMIHTTRRQFAAAILAVEKMMLLQPEEPAHLRDLGYLYTEAQEAGRALKHLEGYLGAAPDAKDHAAVQRLVRQLNQQVAAWN